MRPREFTILTDCHTWQLRGRCAKGPFFRITTARDDRSKIEFAQFGVISTPNHLVLQALNVVSEEFYGPAPGMRLIFRNILAGSETVAGFERYELVARHDHILNLIKTFGRSQDLRVRNSFLGMNHGSFDTLIDLA